MVQTKVPSFCRKLGITKPPCPELLPNYMKSTSSSNARKSSTRVIERSNTKNTPRMMSSANSKMASASTIPSGNNRNLNSSSSALKLAKKTPSFKPTKTVFPSADTNIAPDRPNCSSTLKDSKFPKDLALRPEGTSAVKVCPYTYCSLNGCHRRSPLLPLKCFISSRRRAMKKSNSEETALDLHDNMPVSIEVDYVERNFNKTYEAIDMPESVVDEVGSASSDMDLDGGCCDLMFEIVEAVDMPDARKPEPEHQDAGGTRVPDVIDCSSYDQYDEEMPRIDDDTRSIGIDPVTIDPRENVDSIIFKKRLSEKDETEIDPGRFNPGEPNYLPIVPDPEAEKVDLRHQTIDERRNSNEWMIDYALRQTVTRFDPAARKKKVSLLVEAFEKVMPVPKANTSRIPKWETIILTSPSQIQACS